MTKLLALLITVTLAACGGSPTRPTPPPPTHPVTLTGHLTAVNGGQALPRVQAALGATTAQTGGDGTFSVSALPTASLSLSLTGSSIVPRTLQVAMLTTRDLAVDAIALDGTFDLSFYQALVRDRLESPGLQPLRRWTTHPNIYLQTGVATAQTLNLVDSVVRQSVSGWTSGRLEVATVERGSGSRVGQAGWLTVLFSQETDNGRCGLADIGQSGGMITLYSANPNCWCNGQIRSRTVRHEVGHAMGFYHTGDPADLMHRVAGQCDQLPSAREVYHAAIAYSRPVGNRDPDMDSVGSVALAPMRKQ